MSTPLFDADLITEEYWECDNGDGTGFHTLNTYASNISTLSGRYSLPPRRGDNFVPGKRRGQGFISKVMDARPLSLTMSIIGRRADGFVPLKSQPQMLNNYATLQRLFGVYDRQITFRRRFFQLQDDGVTFALKVVTCQAESTGTFDFSPSGPTAGRAVAEFTMHDPLWYDTDLDESSMSGQTTTNGYGTGNFGDGGWGGLIPVTASVTVEGTAPTYPTVTFIGPCANPSMTYQGLGQSKETWFSLQTTIQAGDQVTADFRQRKVFASADQSYHQEMFRSGSVWWDLQPGVGTLRFYAESTYLTSDASVQWYPAYF